MWGNVIAFPVLILSAGRTAPNDSEPEDLD